MIALFVQTLLFPSISKHILNVSTLVQTFAMRFYIANKLFFIFVLFSLFIIFFGAPSLQHFLREPVIVEIDREEFKDLELPTISICPFEESSGSGIKRSAPDMFWIKNLCSNESFQKVWRIKLFLVPQIRYYLLKLRLSSQRWSTYKQKHYIFSSVNMWLSRSF